MTGLAREVGYLVHGARAGWSSVPLSKSRGKERKREEGGR